MPYKTWIPGDRLTDPLYLDANVFVGSVVRRHRLYKTSALFLGELLASKSQVCLSLVSLEESLWALARLSYYRLNRQPPGAAYKKNIYRRWAQRIFAADWATFSLFSGMAQQWRSVGIPVMSVPDDGTLPSVSSLTADLMRRHHLTPADAAHLALAQTYAQTFVTADSDFKAQVPTSALGSLLVLELRP
ncbi:MAG: type II toxin-antitoxin system VapC family toxin [Chloroflexi bacterium]|nr:type II toxin-antitoxin system VapC family toxin [Chloroflexota bacterium]